MGIVYWLLFNVVAGIPLAKLSSTSVPFNGTKDLLSQIMLFKDNHKALLSVLSDADPAKLNEVITLLKALLTTSQAELLGLTTSSDNADTAFTDAVASHNAAIVAQTNGLGPLATTRDNAIALANTNYNNGVTALQDAVNAAKLIVDSTNSTKVTANGVLAVDQGRLNSEITTLRQVIQLMEGLLGLNTFSPTASPTVSAPSYEISGGIAGTFYDPITNGCSWDGWTVISGDAFCLHSNQNGGIVGACAGSGSSWIQRPNAIFPGCSLSTQHKPEGLVGQVRSPSFSITGDITFWVSGFSWNTRCGNRGPGGPDGLVEIVKDDGTDTVLATNSEGCNDCWAQRTIDLSSHINERAFIRVTDSMNVEGCAWMDVDHFEML